MFSFTFFTFDPRNQHDLFYFVSKGEKKRKENTKYSIFMNNKSNDRMVLELQNLRPGLQSENMLKL